MGVMLNPYGEPVRYFRQECGDDLKFDRSFLAWMKAAEKQTMGAAAKEWLRRKKEP
jgi:hypothetical protein